jgi:hypothetical protein
VIANCATSQCHGGPAGGSLQLITPAESDPATYTNFFVLQSTSKKAPASSGGIFSKGELYMFDRMQPPRSLLLDYSIRGIWPSMTIRKVPNFKPPLRGRDDPRYRLMLNWISNSLRPAPEYGIDYRHKRGPATTQATTEPATQTTVPVPAAAGRSIH